MKAPSFALVENFLPARVVSGFPARKERKFALAHLERKDRFLALCARC
jgi:hypothetical protein